MPATWAAIPAAEQLRSAPGTALHAGIQNLGKATVCDTDMGYEGYDLVVSYYTILSIISYHTISYHVL